MGRHLPLPRKSMWGRPPGLRPPLVGHWLRSRRGRRLQTGRSAPHCATFMTMDGPKGHRYSVESQEFEPLDTAPLRSRL